MIYLMAIRNSITMAMSDNFCFRRLISDKRAVKEPSKKKEST